jgi:hypothetical protein
VEKIGSLSRQHCSSSLPPKNPQNSGTAYWGGKLTGGDLIDKDVIGELYYDLKKMEISFTGTLMKVQIFADFTREAIRGGDLFLSSTGWRAFGTGPHHIGDTFTPDEGWDYVVSSSLIPDPDPPYPSSYRGIWKLDWTSLLWTSGGRDGQAYFKDAGGVKVGDVAVTYAADSLTFVFDYTGLGSLGPASFGVHFTEACGNDVIEGGTPTPPVPAPPTFYLSVVGLVGFALMRKKILK